jgi:EAL domain-containing protein (putative c-di-GMP-specific phosphodiesterase class I)/DNA-binding NarL/FixJ family response regulator
MYLSSSKVRFADAAIMQTVRDISANVSPESSDPITPDARESSQETIRVLIADDDPGILDTLGRLIGAEEAMEVVGSASDADQAAGLAAALHPDVAVVDVRMPGGGGARAAREIKACSPQTRIVALSAFDDPDVVLNMLEAGAVGYMVKDATGSEIVACIRRSANGQAVLSESITGSVIDELVRRVQRPTEESETLEEKVDRVRQMVERSEFHTVFQPILDLRNSRVVGLEALSRFPDRSPDVWFEDAAAAGLNEELELATLQLALKTAGQLPDGLYLSVNLSPATMTLPRFAQVLDGFPLDRLVIEVTEHAPVEDYDALDAVVAPLRAAGCRLAVDDVGAGFSSLRHILRLAPDVIKLDLSLTRHIDSDPPRRALATALISFASAINAAIVAEGIETQDEVDALRALGVTYGQGYHLSRPQPLQVERVDIHTLAQRAS